MSDYKVHIPDESCLHDFCVLFNGPGESKCINWVVVILLEMFQGSTEFANMERQKMEMSN